MSINCKKTDDLKKDHDIILKKKSFYQKLFSWSTDNIHYNPIDNVGECDYAP